MSVRSCLLPLRSLLVDSLPSYHLLLALLADKFNRSFDARIVVAPLLCLLIFFSVFSPFLSHDPPVPARVICLSLAPSLLRSYSLSFSRCFARCQWRDTIGQCRSAMSSPLVLPLLAGSHLSAKWSPEPEILPLDLSRWQSAVEPPFFELDGVFPRPNIIHLPTSLAAVCKCILA